jgi:hypothetical protein
LRQFGIVFVNIRGAGTDNILEPSKNAAKISGGVTEFFFLRSHNSMQENEFNFTRELFVPTDFFIALQSHFDNDAESSSEKEASPE